jgi:hypothetical protein
MLKCIELDERLKAMDQEITVNPQFVQKVNGVPLIKEMVEWQRRGVASFLSQAWELGFRLLTSLCIVLENCQQ